MCLDCKCYCCENCIAVHNGHELAPLYPKKNNVNHNLRNRFDDLIQGRDCRAGAQVGSFFIGTSVPVGMYDYDLDGYHNQDEVFGDMLAYDFIDRLKPKVSHVEHYAIEETPLKNDEPIDEKEIKLVTLFKDNKAIKEILDSLSDA